MISEQSQQVVLTIDIVDVFNQRHFIDGNKLEMNVSGLKSGTYYIYAVPGKNSKHKSEKIRLLPE